MNKGYIYTFEDRIHKDKLPKGLSYVLQTTDITNIFSTNGLSLSYSYDADNPKKVKKERDFPFTIVDFLSYTKYVRRWGEPGSVMDYDRFMAIYSVPAKLRKTFRSILIIDVLPKLKNLESRPKLNISVYYKTFHKNNYEPLDWGGLYIEENRFNDKAKVLYRNKEFDLDKEIKECVS
jgi:hypothetical protein